MAAVVYLTLGLLLAQMMQFNRRTKLFTLGIAIFMTVIVGLSRIYLGVHYPTDVLGGWLVGGCWALLSALAYGVWRRSRRPPSEAQSTGEAQNGRSDPDAGGARSA
jgi:undecaprenyl-diphosphatase